MLTCAVELYVNSLSVYIDSCKSDEDVIECVGIAQGYLDKWYIMCGTGECFGDSLSAKAAEELKVCNL